MVLLEIIVFSKFKKIRKNRFVKPFVDIAIKLDPDRTLKKLRRGRNG